MAERRESGGEQALRVEAERAQGVQAVDGDGEERAALVGAALVCLVDERGEPGAVQCDGGDGAGDATADDDNVFFSHTMTMHAMTMVRQP
nr:hypothetical protein GCM10020092_015940 [Actinoplanes digitatis]